MKEQRKKIWIDRFQTHLLARIVAYLLFYQALVWALVILQDRIVRSVDGAIGQGVGSLCLLFAVVCVVLLGFMFVCDAARFAHRLVGPLVRFHKTVQAVTAGEEVDLVKLRQGDFLHELRDEFNEMLRALEQRGAVVLKTPVDEQDKDQPLAA